MASNQFTKMSDLSLDRPTFLGDWFFGSAKRYPDRIALVVGKREYSFSELSNAAQNVALELMSRLSEEVFLVGLFGHRTAASFAGLLGILASGRGYVPINHKFPLVRSVQMLNSSGIRDIVVDVFFLKSLVPLLETLDSRLTIYCLGSGQTAEDIQVPDKHKIIWVETNWLPDTGMSLN